MDNTSIIVIGSLNTDIIAKGVSRFPNPGEHVWGKELVIGPGGKSRNIAAMAGHLSSTNQVAMISRTAKDIYGLWEPPVDALQAAGVDTNYVCVLEPSETDKMPAVALIPVNREGESQIILLPGVSDDFSIEDVEAAQSLFTIAAKNNGFLVLTLECPFETAKYAIEKASAMGIKVVLDPGGIESNTDIASLMSAGLYLIKPNEHEAKMITGLEVIDFASARLAADKLKDLGAINVLITHGDRGAYLFSKDSELHITVDHTIIGDTKDATGCGDQTIATVCVYLQEGKSLEEAAKAAIVSGTLQFHKAGIQPITKVELENSV